MEITQELITKLREAGSKEAFAGILAENKIELTPEEVDGWYQHESKIAEMSEEELAQVTGGGVVRTPNTRPAYDSLLCDHRDRGTCSVPHNVCNGRAWQDGGPMLAKIYGSSMPYAHSCRRFVNNYHPVMINH